MHKSSALLLILLVGAAPGRASGSDFLKFLEPRLEFIPSCAAPGTRVTLRSSGWIPSDQTPCDCVATLVTSGDTLAAQLGLLNCCQNLQFNVPFSGGSRRLIRVTRRSPQLQCVDGWLAVGTCSVNPWPQSSGYSRGVQVLGSTQTSVEWRVTFDPKNLGSTPYTSFIGLLPVARITGRLSGSSTTRLVLPSELDAGKAYLDSVAVAGYFLDFNDCEEDPWANGDARSDFAAVLDPVDRARNSYGGYKESSFAGDTYSESSLFARQVVNDDTLAALGLEYIAIRYDVVAVVGDGPDAGTRLGYAEFEFQRQIGQKARIVTSFSTVSPPTPQMEAAISEAMSAYFSPRRSFVWPLLAGAPVWGIRWGSCD